MTRVLTAVALSVLFFLAACGDKTTDDRPETAAQEPETVAEQAPEGAEEFKRGPYGGLLVVLGAKEGHLEVAPNHMAGAVTIVTYDNEMIEMPQEKPPVLNFMSVDGPKQLVGEGEGAEWIFMDETLKEKFKQLRFKLVIGGKTYTPVWDHVHPPK